MRPLAEAIPARHGLDHPGFDGEVRGGMLVVHKRASPEVVEIFRELFNAMFRIEEMHSYETYTVGECASQDSLSASDGPAYGLACRATIKVRKPDNQDEARERCDQIIHTNGLRQERPGASFSFTGHRAAR